MIKNFFGINLCFNRKFFKNFIEKKILLKQKGYVCVVDVNIVAMTNKNSGYKKIINNSIINACDGSSIAFLANLIYFKSYESYNGPNIFSDFIKNPEYTHTIVGGDKSDYIKIINKLKRDNKKINNINYIELPFMSVDKFNYEEIATKLNKFKSDMIWISLGAPKQEIFMSHLIKYLNTGVMFGIGAALKFYHGELNLPNLSFFGLKFIWVMRIIQEPKKIIKRHLSYLFQLPTLIFNEIKK